MWAVGLVEAVGLGSVTSYAGVARIHDIWDDGAPTVQVLINEDGKILQVEKNSKWFSLLQLAFELKKPVSVETSAEPPFKVLHAEWADSAGDTAFETVIKTDEAEYEPTVIVSQDELTQIFKSLRPDSYFKGNSQCFRRAHTWAYDMWKSAKHIKSMKVFLFFTRKYINEYRYGWWFHVAPYVVYAPTLNGNALGAEQNNEAVLDRTFFEAPFLLNDWATAFMKNQARCRVIDSYVEVDQPKDTDYCLVRKLPMYYYAPVNVENLDKQGVKVSDFSSWELRDMTRDNRRTPWGD